MFTLTTHHLAPDGRSADPVHGDRVVGELEAAELIARCEVFRQLDPVENHRHDPHLALQGPGGRFIVRTDHGRLFAYNARNTSEPAIPVDGPALVGLLDGVRPAGPADPDVPVWTPQDERKARRRTLLGVGLLVAALGLNGAAAYLLLQPPDKDPPVAYEPVTDAALIETQSRRLAGLYATGTEPGDHRILVRADGNLSLQDLGEEGRVVSESPESYRLGRSNGAFCLVVGDATTRIDVLSADTLLYCGDTYQRVTR